MTNYQHDIDLKLASEYTKRGLSVRFLSFEMPSEQLIVESLNGTWDIKNVAMGCISLRYLTDLPELFMDAVQTLTSSTEIVWRSPPKLISTYDVEYKDTRYTLFGRLMIPIGVTDVTAGPAGN